MVSVFSVHSTESNVEFGWVEKKKSLFNVRVRQNYFKLITSDGKIPEK